MTAWLTNEALAQFCASSRICSGTISSCPPGVAPVDRLSGAFRAGDERSMAQRTARALMPQPWERRAGLSRWTRLCLNREPKKLDASAKAMSQFIGHPLARISNRLGWRSVLSCLEWLFTSKEWFALSASRKFCRIPHSLNFAGRRIFLPTLSRNNVPKKSWAYCQQFQQYAQHVRWSLVWCFTGSVNPFQEDSR